MRNDLLRSRIVFGFGSRNGLYGDVSLSDYNILKESSLSQTV